MNFYTSDEHYFHFNIIKYANRKFKSVEEMNKTLIENSNKVVKKEDKIYHMGDFCFGELNNVKRVLKQLNGEHHLIVGNHCRHEWADYIRAGFASVQRYKFMDIKGVGPVGLCHDPSCCITAPDIPWLVGHLHQQFVRFGNAINVGVDVRNMTPVSEEDLEQDFKITSININHKDWNAEKEILGKE